MKTPNLEAVKEVLRYLVLFVISWIITETLKQVEVLPEFYNIKVWVLSYTVPLRMMVTFALTAAGRYLDKLVFERSKQDPRLKFGNEEPKGVIPF